MPTSLAGRSLFDTPRFCTSLRADGWYAAAALATFATCQYQYAYICNMSVSIYIHMQHVSINIHTHATCQYQYTYTRNMSVSIYIHAQHVAIIIHTYATHQHYYTIVHTILLLLSLIIACINEARTQVSHHVCKAHATYLTPQRPPPHTH
jgi:hypothetical protein